MNLIPRASKLGASIPSTIYKSSGFRPLASGPGLILGRFELIYGVRVVGNQRERRATMTEEKNAEGNQPEPFTPGMTKGMVRQHAFEMFRDKLARDERLTLDDWVMAEKDLVRQQEDEGR
jgi:hypothetical protein